MFWIVTDDFEGSLNCLELLLSNYYYYYIDLPVFSLEDCELCFQDCPRIISDSV